MVSFDVFLAYNQYSCVPIIFSAAKIPSLKEQKIKFKEVLKKKKKAPINLNFFPQESRFPTSLNYAK